MGLTDVSNILWRERQLLEVLLFKLEEEQLLLANKKTRWLAMAAAEIEDVLEGVRMAELSRSVEVDSLAVELGLVAGSSLRELAAVAPPPWGHILEDHRQAFVTVTQEIAALAEANRELITRGQRDVQEALAWLGEERDDTYSAAGTSSASHGGARIIDRSL
jgi:hypothetical protein